MKIVFYHRNCQDGFTAAVVARLALGPEAKLVAISHSERLPEVTVDSDVYFLDICPTLHQLSTLSAKGVSVTVLDHHKSSFETLAGRTYGDNVTLKFDMAKCGSELAWEHFFPSKETPPLIQYVADRDLWKWELPQSREVTTALAAQPFDVDMWERFLTDPSALVKLKNDGQVLVLERDKRIEEILGSGVTYAYFRGFLFPVVNAPSYLASEVCDEMLKRIKHAPFVGSFWLVGNGVVRWSFRSEDSRTDVSSIARQIRYGMAAGGGHRNAAGATEACLGEQIALLGPDKIPTSYGTAA